jgi:4-diphosphocytidyl-2-C-methyl-D-erythritol kinase
MNTVKETANAKINLYLDVISKREDGFHNIKTVMHSISLSDTVKVSLVHSGERGVRLKVNSSHYLPTDSKNLAALAAQLFLDSTGINATVEIELTKRIPISAGLAGGSSDAAATLRALNKLFGKVLGERMMLKLAAKIGSDVPYCLIGKTALCEGRGEIITRLPEPKKLYVVVAIGNEHVSTPEAYKTLDRLYNDFKEGRNESSFDKHITSIKEGTFSGQTMYNIFEDAVLQNYEGARRIKERLSALSGGRALMSGSGPSVFAIFDTEEDAKKASDTLISEGINAYFATSV